MRIAIVGAGLAGLACGEALQAAAHEVTLFDKGSRPGGRMSMRTLATPLGDVGFDYGAQYLSVKDPSFRARVDRWLSDGVVAKWPTGGGEVWVGVPGMDAPIVDLAGHLDVTWSARVDALIRRSDRWHLRGERVDAGGFDAVVVAVPAEQVSPLLGTLDPHMAAAATDTPSQPCWALMAAFPDALPIETDVIKSDGPIAWAARNSSKPCRNGIEAWVIHASPSWTQAHLENKCEDVAVALLVAFADEIGLALAKPLACVAHRWRYAKSGRSKLRHIWNCKAKLGLCGDWLIGPKVESAYLSGTSLASVIATSTGLDGLD